ncbi:hypothetical protein ACFWZ2_23420 [Streptomyces sp. NPDC059002]|uniref:hypothetical protein n=1 Tax=Streptomyces sp. NPDC059002 TaxID=3346690 RepID=UPI0036BDA40F
MKKQKQKRNRTAVAVPLLALLAAAALSGCGGSDSDSGSSDDSAGNKPKASAPEAVEPAAKLDDVALAKDEVKGFTVKKPDQEYAFAKSRDEIKVGKAGCAPLAYATNQFPLGSPESDLTRVATGAKGPGAFTYVTLATYAKGGAKTALAEFSKAVGSCGGGFTAKAGGNTSTYTSVTAESAAKPAGADESVAFKATTEYQDLTHTVRGQAVRHGETLALYFAVDGLAFTQSRPGDAKVATAVVDAQSAKL